MNTTRFATLSVMGHSLLTIPGVAGVAALFLPFTFGVSPVAAVLSQEWEVQRLALPLFLAPFASAGALRWISSGSFSRFERVTAYVLGSTLAFLTLSLSLLALLFEPPTTVHDWIILAAPLVALCVGICLLIRNSRRKRGAELNPVVAIQIPYLAHSALLLIAFFGEWQVGAYCVLAAAMAFLFQIILTSWVQ